MPEAPSMYRPVRPLPVELQEQCTIYFEEGLHNQALTLLINNLSSGGSNCPETNLVPVLVPSPEILAFISTLAVHPSLTTRTKSDDRLVAASQALHYLWGVRCLVGPENAKLNDAFRYTKYQKRPGELEAKLAKHQSIWSSADDFWHVVGWAFNCAVTSPLRWARWRVWLELMLEMLEVDLMDRVLRAKASGEDYGAQLSQSMIAQYVSGTGDSIRNVERTRILRAIFAHGTSRDLAEFKEIWKDELKAADDRKDSARARLAQLHDLSEEEDDVEMADASVPNGRRQSKRAKQSRAEVTRDQESESPATTEANGIDKYSATETTKLRQRLLTLLDTLCVMSDTVFAIEPVLLDLCADPIRDLPLPIYSALLKGRDLELPFMSSLCKWQFQILLATTPPLNTNLIGQTELEQIYLPAAANSTSAVNNAKVSLLLEQMLWRLADGGSGFMPKGNLSQAITTGIKARRAKAAQNPGRRSSKTEDAAAHQMGLTWLEASSKRLALLVQIMG